MENRNRDVSNRPIALAAILLVVVTIALSAILSQMASQAVREQIADRMLDVASSAAALLDGDALASFTAQDQETPQYKQVMSILAAFQDSMELSYIYCVRQAQDGTFEFTVDPAVDNPAIFGEKIRATEALQEAGRGHATADFESYEDRWGRFYSAYCPVFDSSGNVASIVGVDFSAPWFEERIQVINRIIIFNSFAVLVVAALAIVAVNRFTLAETRHENSMLKANRYDSLTGLAKMSYFFEVANKRRKKIAADDELAILYIDMAGMKYFNQRHGFSEGDSLLKSVADLLERHFGHENCSRFGQDHFAVCTNTQDLDTTLDAFIEDVSTSNGGKNLPLRIGVYPFSMGDVEISVACDRAKMATVANGVSYRSTYTYFDQSMFARNEQRRYVVDNIDRAIAEGWIQVYYQPIVRAENGRVCEEESLARWIDPQRGFLSPAEFIPALEDAKLVYKLDLNVLDQTLKKMHRFADEGLYVVPSSINLSRSDFEACDMVEEVRRRVDASGFSRNMVNIEITETAMGRDFEFMKLQVERFHDLGFRVWMDDFGSEYSSLDYLQNLTFDLIKLDMRFMQQFDKGEKSKVILTELVKMAIGLGIDTICEGVETQEQVDFLREVGCNKLQGYFFTKPISLEDVLLRYQNGTAIGFENPAESGYYAALGRVSLHDLSSIAREDEAELHKYFNTLPMAIYEVSNTEFAVVRCNKSYRSFMAREFIDIQAGMRIPFEDERTMAADDFLLALRKCGESGGRIAIDGALPSGTSVHAFARRVAVNPVTGVAALAVVVLSVE